jgi:hypothetical protein
MLYNKNSINKGNRKLCTFHYFKWIYLLYIINGFHWLFFFFCTGVEPRVFCKLGKHSTIECYLPISIWLISNISFHQNLWGELCLSEVFVKNLKSVHVGVTKERRHFFSLWCIYLLTYCAVLLRKFEEVIILVEKVQGKEPSLPLFLTSRRSTTQPPFVSWK